MKVVWHAFMKVQLKDICLLSIFLLIQVQSTAVPKETGWHIYIKWNNTKDPKDPKDTKDIEDNYDIKYMKDN